MYRTQNETKNPMQEGAFIQYFIVPFLDEINEIKKRVKNNCFIPNLSAS